MTASAVRAAGPAAPSPTVLYRDDGPLGRALGALGRRVPAPPVLLVLAAITPLAVLLAIHGEDPPLGALGAAIGWAVVVGGLSSGRPHQGKLDWASPTILRLLEYATLVWMAAIADAMPAAFALLCAIAFRHYDIVYRLRHRQIPPPAWINAIGGGWEGRLIVAFALLSLDVLEEGLFAAALLLGVISVGESAAGWARQSARGMEDDDDEADVT